MTQEEFKLCCNAMISVAVFVFAVCSIVPAIGGHKSDKPKVDDQTNVCPYCCNRLKPGKDGFFTCDCDDCLAVFESNECTDCNIVFTGPKCPKCSGRVVWL
jgi:hypothetical protein